MPTPVLIIIIGVVSLIGFSIFISFVPIPLWINALFAGVKVSLASLVGMRLRKVPPFIIVNALITATKAGLQLTTNDLETHYLSGGNVPRVVNALIAADKAEIELDFKWHVVLTLPEEIFLKRSKLL